MKRINLYYDLFERQHISKSLLIIKHNIDDEVLYQFDGEVFNSDLKKEIFSIQNTPDYLNFRYHTNLNKKVILQERKGYAVNLSNITDVDAYIKSRFKKKANNITTRLHRLETCFNINYSIVYGKDVTIAEYDFIMGALHNFLIKRFRQKQDTSLGLLNGKIYMLILLV